jgi:hypothetical protein
LIFPDFQGGLVGMVGNQYGDPHSFARWDGMTGQVVFTTPPIELGLCGSDEWLEVCVAVHPDGTIFAIKYAGKAACNAGSVCFSVVGIDPATGAQKFSVPIPNGGGVAAPMIVAGDGYAYLPYVFAPSDPGAGAMHVLRVDSSGRYDDLAFAADPGHNTYDGFEMHMITNADKGVVLTWGADLDTWPSLAKYGMAVTTGTSVSVVNAPLVPGQHNSPVNPLLQAQDGSFVGEVELEPQEPVEMYAMVSFDAAGNVRWIVPNDWPQIATADGGVIGRSGTVYDANGNAAGQTSLLTQSWTGNLYQDGDVQRVAAKPTVAATGFWSGSAQSPPGANASGTPVAVQTAQVRLHVFKLNGTAQIDLTGIVEAAQKIWAKQSNGAIALLWDHSIQNTDPCATPGCVKGGLDDLLNILSYNHIGYWLQLKDFLQKFPDRQGINVVQNAALPSGSAITLNIPIAPAPKLDSTTLSNIIVLPNNTSKVLGHEVGHAFGLHHVSNPLNLMCGAPEDASDAVAFIDSFWCFEWTARSLNDDQLKTAKAKALTLVEK